VKKVEPLIERDRAMMKYTKYLKNTASKQPVAKTDEYLQFGSMSKVENLKEHPAFASLFTDEWKVQLKTRLETFLEAMEKGEKGEKGEGGGGEKLAKEVRIWSPSMDAASHATAAAAAAKGLGGSAGEEKKKEEEEEEEAAAVKMEQAKAKAKEEEEKAAEKAKEKEKAESSRTRAVSRWQTAFSFIKGPSSSTLSNDSGSDKEKDSPEAKPKKKNPLLAAAQMVKEKEKKEQEQREQQKEKEQEQQSSSPKLEGREGRTPTLFQGLDYKPVLKQKVPNLKAEARTDSGLAGRVTVESGMSIVQTVKKMNVGEVNTAAIHDKNKQKEAESKTNDAWASVFRDGSPTQVKRDEAAGEEGGAGAGGERLSGGGSPPVVPASPKKKDAVAVSRIRGLTYTQNAVTKLKEAAARGREMSID
jgi:hypothetical protein